MFVSTKVAECLVAVYKLPSQNLSSFKSTSAVAADECGVRRLIILHL